MAEWLTERLTEWLTQCLTELLIEWFTGIEVSVSPARGLTTLCEVYVRSVPDVYGV